MLYVYLYIYIYVFFLLVKKNIQSYCRLKQKKEKEIKVFLGAIVSRIFRFVVAMFKRTDVKM